MRRSTILLTALAACALGAPATAAADSDVPPTRPCTTDPPKGTVCLADSWLGDLHISPHTVKPGGTVTATWEPLNLDDIPDWGSASAGVGLERKSGCKLRKGPLKTWRPGYTTQLYNGDWSCAWKVAEDAAEGIYILSFPLINPIGGAVEQDWIRVSGDGPIIDGFVRGPEKIDATTGKVSAVGDPVRGVKVSVRGPSGSKSGTTDKFGYFKVKGLKSGTYSVRAGDEYCDTAVPAPKCENTVKVKLGASGHATFAARRKGSIKGTVRGTECGTSSCTTKPQAGVKLSAKREGKTLSATTNAKGEYTIKNVERGVWDVKPAGEGFDPEKRVVSVTSSDVLEQDFEGCVKGEGAARRFVYSDDACTRVYTVTVRSWIPTGGNVLDVYNGPKTPDGSDFPITAPSSSTISLSKRWPSCIDSDKRDLWMSDSRDVTWRAWFRGHGHVGSEGPSLGDIGVRLLWNGMRNSLTVLGTTTTAGTLRRDVDVRVDGLGRRDCSETRATLPAAFAHRGSGGNEVVLGATWSFPYKPIESLEVARSLKSTAPDVHPSATTKKVAEATFDEYEASHPDFKAKPAALRSAIKQAITSLVDLGFSKSKILKSVDDFLKAGKGELLGWSEGPLKWPKKYQSLIAKTAYPSPDARVTIQLKTEANALGGYGTQLVVTAETDSWPSYGLTISRGHYSPDPLPIHAANGPGSVERGEANLPPYTDPGRDRVIVDASGIRVNSGGLDVEAAMRGNLGILQAINAPFVGLAELLGSDGSAPWVQYVWRNTHS